MASVHVENRVSPSFVTFHTWDRILFLPVREPRRTGRKINRKSPQIRCFIHISFFFVYYDCDHGDRGGGSVIGVITTARVLYSQPGGIVTTEINVTKNSTPVIIIIILEISLLFCSISHSRTLSSFLRLPTKGTHAYQDQLGSITYRDHCRCHVSRYRFIDVELLKGTR